MLKLRTLEFGGPDFMLTVLRDAVLECNADPDELVIRFMRAARGEVDLTPDELRFAFASALIHLAEFTRSGVLKA